MYHMDHPSATQSLVEFFNTVTEGLQILSPLVLIMTREQFFIEEEPLDPRINTAKMVNHFKKANIQSVSFERGMREAELESFIRVFTDLNKYPTAESMKKSLSKRGVINIRVNHVIYKKMTADDEIVSRDQLKDAKSGLKKGVKSSLDAAIEKMMAEGIIMEELEKSLSLKNLIEDPTRFSEALIDVDFAHTKMNQADESKPGTLLSHQLQRIREKVATDDPDRKEIHLVDLAEAVFALRKDLLKGIQAQRAMGVLFADEAKIREEINALADQVVIRLVKEEYKKGEISIKRLAQLLRRIIPETKELRRLLPKIKEALLAEGMPLCEFLQLPGNGKRVPK